MGKKKIPQLKKIISVVILSIGSISLFSSCDIAGIEKKKLQQKPNIIIIYADDIGYGDLGCYGATKVKTPNIDKLAEEGRTFTDAHSPSAVCTPSRYGFLTGQYAWRINQFGPLQYDRPMIINTTSQTLPRLLKQHGYSTAIIGKWHLGFGEEGLTDWNNELTPGPLDVGFDYFYGIPLVNSHGPFIYVENRHVLGLDPEDPFILRQENELKPFNKDLPRSPTQDFPEKYGLERWSGANKAHNLYRDEYIGTELTQKAVSWIKDQTRRRKEKPFFLHFATTNIHHPFTPHPRFQGTSQAGRYGDFIHELDWMVGELLNTLDEEGIAENTLIIFTSDNGGMFNEGGKDALKSGHKLNGDLLGFKFGVWEGGHRIPLIARWPGHIPPGSHSDQLVGNIDMLGTVAELMNYSLKENEGPDSYSILPALTGSPQKNIRDHLILAPHDLSHLAIRKGDWLYIGGQGSGGFPWPLGGPKAIVWASQENSDITPDGTIRVNAPKQQLYNLKSDPSQKKNIILENPEIAEALKKELDSIKTVKRSRN